MKTKNLPQETKTISTSEIENFDPQVFSDTIDRSVRANLVMRDLAMEVNRQLVDGHGSTIDIRGTNPLQAAGKPEGGSTNKQTWDHDAVRVEMYDVREVPVEYTDEALEDSNVQEMEETALEIGEALAERNDQDAYDLVTNRTYELDTLKYDAGTELQDEAFEQVVDSDGTIDYSSTKNLVMTMNDNRSRADSLVVSFQHLGDLLDEDKFILANKAATDEGLREGRIGRFAGVNVHVTEIANTPSTGDNEIQGLVLDSDRAFAEAVKREPTMEMDRDTQNGKDFIVGRMRYGHEIVNGEAVGWLVNSSA